MFTELVKNALRKVKKKINEENLWLLDNSKQGYGTPVGMVVITVCLLFGIVSQLLEK